MKKYIIGILMLGILLFALCGCGGTPLAKAYDSLSALDEEGPAGEEGMDEMDRAALPDLWNVQYDEENEVLFLYIDNGADLDPIFDALNKAIDGQDIGTLIFYLDGTKGDDWEKGLDQKLSELSCNSMERLGLNYYLIDYPTHKWLALADKTDKLYVDTNMSAFWDYKDKDLKQLNKFKDVQMAYNSSMRLSGISRLDGMETLSIVPAYAIEPVEEQDPLAAVTEDNPYLNDQATSSEDSAVAEIQSESETTAADESGAETPAPLQFEYFSSSNDGIEDLANLESLKTVLIFPETGYELSAGGEIFMKTLQYLDPDLQVNAPGEAGAENLIPVSEVETPNVTDEQAAGILAEFLAKEIEPVYKECDKYSKKDGDAVLNGKCLIFAADPPMDKWSEKKVFTTAGKVQLQEPAKEGIKVPEAVGDYKTFVYIYPTYSRTGVYTSGTKAYSQTLHVQVFDMENKTAYEAESVGTEAAPQSFSYFVGSVPDKHSGEVSLDKAYKYLSKLKTK